MIDLIIKLVGKVVELVSHKEATGRRLFEDHIDPIYQDIRLVYVDYQEVLFHIKHLAKDPKVGREQILAELRERRKRLERLRKELDRYSVYLLIQKAGIKGGRVGHFAVGCLDILFKDVAVGEREIRRRKTPTVLSSLLNEIERDQHLFAEHRQPLLDLIDEYLVSVNSQWEQTAYDYFALRVECLK